ERALRLEADDRVVQVGPLLGECADIQVDARQRTQNSDTVGSVEEYTGRVTRIGRLRRLLGDRVQEIREGLDFGRIQPGARQACVDVEDRGDGVCIVDVIRADQRGIDRTGLLACQE